MQPPSPPRVGVSACLLGEDVRWDGGHKREDFLARTLARFVTFVPVCPEVELGLGTPREPIRLERHAGGLRLVAIASRRDLTAAMREYAEAKVDELSRLGLSGYVLKARSPTCGMGRVEVFDREGHATADGRGLFATVLKERIDDLPVEEEDRLRVPAIRDAFLERLFACHRLHGVLDASWTPEDLKRLHASERLLVAAHDPTASEELDGLVASAGPPEPLARRYRRRLLSALARPVDPARHAEFLAELAARLRPVLPPGEQRELDRTIARFLERRASRAVPLALLQRLARAHGVLTIAEQTYLEPYPFALIRGARRMCTGRRRRPRGS